MPAFAPDLSQYWLPESGSPVVAVVAKVRDEELDAPALLQQFEALVDRVNAARSIF
ncbi:MAG: hypothetical protein IPG28_15975 [Betaproteobacteria bacterium]|jgi:hypothetical protein|nr:hypothetical protein [Betaproteobacteria bacterium]MBK6602996.1 hypothetical protein [Betaproteobacteria bacterium]MBK7080048.1 hypothetical protein [Betaproteobacteria bacterium]MBK7593054.1 hypothetical protein [Betaproteobacteria bacterium]MBK7743279.1 hypothetical protein [Betaproteobacteria bacterium]